MQLSALTAPVIVISHFCCHKSTFTSLTTGVQNYFWPRKILVFLSFYKGSAGRFSLQASGEEKRKLQIGGMEGGDERQRESDGEERRSEGMMSQLTGRGAKQ